MQLQQHYKKRAEKDQERGTKEREIMQKKMVDGKSVEFNALACESKKLPSTRAQKIERERERGAMELFFIAHERC